MSDLVHKIEVTSEWWNDCIRLYNGEFTKFDNRNDLENFLIEIISKVVNSLDDLIDTVVILPKEVSRHTRYCLHKLTIRNEFVPSSHDDEDGNRIMHLEISRKYLLEVFKDYRFPVKEEEPLTVEEIQLKTDKQMIFDDLMLFIHKNLENEFKEYLKTF
jgi:hypothetical protein